MAIYVPSGKQQRGATDTLFVSLKIRQLRNSYPRGYEIRKSLILMQTNNVSVAPLCQNQTQTDQKPFNFNHS
jgi:hypothetical protein